MENREEKWLREEKYGGADTDAYQRDVARLRAGEPLAYVIGSIPFLGLTIHLDSHPLIPRPETEWWTEKLIATLSPGVRVLDLCAGSGAVGCAILKQVPDARVSFGEIDPAHGETIAKNIRENEIDASRADIRIGDLFAPFADVPPSTFDVIAANPPYIPSMRALDDSVAKYEPALALRGGVDGLELVRRIASDAPRWLTEGGALWMEVDSEHADAARDLVEAAGLRASIIPDQYERPRLIVGYL